MKPVRSADGSMPCDHGSWCRCSDVLLVGGAPASAEPRTGVPGDQPLPGYTISNSPLKPEVVDGQPTRVLQGVHWHSAYVVEVPTKWNGRFAM